MDEVQGLVSHQICGTNSVRYTRKALAQALSTQGELDRGFEEAELIAEVVARAFEIVGVDRLPVGEHPHRARIIRRFALDDAVRRHLFFRHRLAAKNG